MERQHLLSSWFKNSTIAVCALGRSNIRTIITNSIHQARTRTATAKLARPSQVSIPER